MRVTQWHWSWYWHNFWIKEVLTHMVQGVPQLLILNKFHSMLNFTEQWFRGHTCHCHCHWLQHRHSKRQILEKTFFIIYFRFALTVTISDFVFDIAQGISFFSTFSSPPASEPSLEALAVRWSRGSWWGGGWRWWYCSRWWSWSSQSWRDWLHHLEQAMTIELMIK